MQKLFFFSILFLTSFWVQSQILEQRPQFTEADSLRGGLRAERENYNVLHYELDIKINPEKKFITGVNHIQFETLADLPKMQIDLYKSMKIDSIVFEEHKVDYKRKHDAIFISFDETLAAEQQNKISVYYSGQPTEAKRPPWDGGFVFDKDDKGNHFIGVSVQGDGASLWFPNKDHLSDEPDNGADIKVAVPNGLMNVSNGKLIAETDLENGYTQWHWRVINPINNYNITVNIGDYINFKDEYKDLALDYYVLSDHLEIAQDHFEVVHNMMDCFYEKFGPYPFQEDSYKLVESPYLGMEHQSNVAYGNQFSSGYLGNDLSGTGIGLKFDFIIIHESAHEWFGNSISVADIADLWIHEGFTTYAEAVFIECEYGKEDALSYLYGIRRNIQNQRPLIGEYGVNYSGPGDVYYKGANVINTLRSVVADDDLWWKTLKKFNEEFKHRVTNTEEVIAFFNRELNEDYSTFFEQYLYHTEIPVLQFRKKGRKVEARWKTNVAGFEMPIEVGYPEKDERYRILLNDKWVKTDLKIKNIEELRIDTFRFYVEVDFLNQ
ncbi:MAG: M1 family metallopeptidase [Bacteroidota bacterium]